MTVLYKLLNSSISASPSPMAVIKVLFYWEAPTGILGGAIAPLPPLCRRPCIKVVANTFCLRDTMTDLRTMVSLYIF